MSQKLTIEIYGQKNCGHCDRAVQHAADHGFPVTYRDIADKLSRDEMLRRNPAATTVPQIFIGEKLIGGASELLTLSDFQLQQMIGE